MNSLTYKQKNKLIRIIISAIFFAGIIVLHKINSELSSLTLFVLFLIPYFIIGYDIIRKCFLGIAHRQMFDECFLMTLATIGAFGCQEFEEAVAVMLFYQVGEFFQSYSIGKSRDSIQELMNIAPEFANRINEDGSVEIVDPDDVEFGDILMVKPGEKIPVDSIVIDGSGYINTSALTGESMPVYVEKDDDLISGCVNGDSTLKIQATKVYDDSTVAQILELVENAANRKSKTEAFITRFARYYTPVVVICAVLLAFVTPIFTGNLGMWVLRACTFLVISCPCALVISVPLAFFGGIGSASRNGVLVKGANYLEMMAEIDTVVSDKTGTLTQGNFSVSRIEAADGYNCDDVIKYAAAVESASTHPIAKAIIDACDIHYPANKIKQIENFPGKGLQAIVGHDTIIVGNNSIMIDAGVDLPQSEFDDFGTVIFVAKNRNYIGKIYVEDAIKPEAESAINDIIKTGVKHFVMLTGDSEFVANAIASKLGINEYKSELLPQEKVKAVEDLLPSLPKHKHLAFIGDGINDAPVLRRADVGIAMGSLGSDAAIEAADIVIMDDNMERIPLIIKIARKTISISKTNIAFALTVKLMCLILGALGIANMWVAVFADVGVAMICILNSMRMLVKKL